MRTYVKKERWEGSKNVFVYNIVYFCSTIVYTETMETKERTASFYQTEDAKEPAREWLDSLKDKQGQAKILTRIRRAETGNFGDHKGVGEGISELRITHGPAYRVYYGIDDSGDLIILLVGGDKSTQEKDIEKARSYWQDYKKRRQT